jgi:hypothetical protein
MGAPYVDPRIPVGLCNSIWPDLASVVSAFRGDAIARRAITTHIPTGAVTLGKRPKWAAEYLAIATRAAQHLDH